MTSFKEKSKKMSKKIRLTEYLVSAGHAADLKEASARIMAGEVYVDQQPAKNGMLILPDSNVTVKGETLPYASKGVLKLTGALEDFNIDVSGLICIDAGASTGGFTDCLRRHGASLVYAVDVGYGQLTGRLRQDKGVVNLERTNISDPQLLCLDPLPSLGTIDCSYLSLRKAIPYFTAILHGRGQLVCLVKPLFEIDDPAVRRSGIIPDEAYAPLLRDLIRDINLLPGTVCSSITFSHITGNSGTREFFLHVLLGEGLPARDITAEIDPAVEKAQLLQQYKKV